MVEALKPKLLAKALLSHLNSKALMSEKIRMRIVDHFSVEKVVAQTVETLQKMTG